MKPRPSLLRTAPVAALVAAALSGVALGACSLALDFEDECATDADCATQGRGLRCDQGFCVAKDLVEVSGPCNRIYGVDPRTAEPGAVIMLGTLLPRSGALGAFGDGMDNGVRLAVDEINQAGGVLGKKLGVLSCDDGTDVDVAEAAARHLVDVAGVDAIIGAGASSVTIETFNRVAKANRVLMISPSASSPIISDQSDDGLLWRTVPSDAIQGRVIARYVIDRGFDVIGVVSRNDAYGTGLAGEVYKNLCEGSSFNCTTATYIPGIYSAEDKQAIQVADQARIATEMADKRPDAIVLIGYVPDGIALINEMVRQGFEPQLILTDGMRDVDLLGGDAAQPGINSNAVRCSVVGTNPASPNGPPFDRFAFDFEALFQGPPGTFASNAYDAAYVLTLGYAAAKGAGIDEPDGRALAENLARISDKSGTRVPVGRDGIGSGVQILTTSATTTIDLEGVSGPLDFDASVGEAPSGIEMWRLELVKGEISNLGIVYDGQDLYNFAGIVPRTAGGPCDP